MRNAQKNFLIFLLLIFLFCFNFFVIKEIKAGWWEKAQESGVKEIGQKAFDKTEESQHIAIIVAKVVKAFLGFMGLVFLVMLIIAGYQYFTSMGDANKTKDALDSIKHAIIGLIIMLSAYVLARFVTDEVYKIVIKNN